MFEARAENIRSEYNNEYISGFMVNENTTNYTFNKGTYDVEGKRNGYIIVKLTVKIKQYENILKASETYIEKSKEIKFFVKDQIKLCPHYKGRVCFHLQFLSNAGLNA